MTTIHTDTIRIEINEATTLDQAMQVARMFATPGTEVTITIDRPEARTRLAKFMA